MSLAEITVISSGSAEPGLDFVAAAFEKETGCAVQITYNQGARAKKRLEDGDFDVVVATRNAIERMFRQTGLVEAGGVFIGRAGIGVAIRPDARVPDISTAPALRRALIEAESVLITTETSGLYIEDLMRKMGITEQVEAKSSRYPNAPALVERLCNGSGNEIGFLPVNAIRTHSKKGIVLAGPLPDELQFDRDFIAVPAAKSKQKEAAWRFVHYCGGPGRPLLVANGLL